jgi:hypothetical protein
MAKTVKAKRSGFGLEMKTFPGSKGTYVVFKTAKGGYHAFVETEAKDAAMDCESELPRARHTQAHWDALWARQEARDNHNK